jgi:uncharacterized membrane protein
MSLKLDKEILYSMGNNPSNWRGMFYVNRKDPRIIVPKRMPSMGWTLNFGHTVAYVIITAIVLAAWAGVYFSK